MSNRDRAKLRRLKANSSRHRLVPHVMLGTDALAFAPEVPKDLKVEDVLAKERQDAESKVTVAGKKPGGKWRGQSMYPKLLQEMITTVLAHESFLFSDTERRHLEHLSSLAYGPRYLFVRLALRRRSKLHRLSDLQLKYEEELGDEVQDHMEALCSQSFSCIAADGLAAQDADVELYAHDETNLKTEELLSALKLDEIKGLANKLKVPKNKTTRAEIIAALLNTASKQSTLSLSFFKPPVPRPSPRPALANVPPTPSTPPRSTKQLPVVIDLVSPPRAPPRPKTNSTSRLRELILGIEKKFIRISEQMFSLLQRVNLVYFRSTSSSSNTLLLPLILSRSYKRHYPSYTSVRTAEVFSSRDHLIAYEKALKLEAELEEEREGERESRTERGKRVYEVVESVLPRWRELVRGVREEGEDGAYARPGLERFEEGHVLTRIVGKGADALASLHRYEEEIALLRELLSQKRWRKGKRGLWYERLALVLMQHLGRPQEAMEVVIEGLNDELTHIVTRPRLVRRLARLEKRLKVPASKKHKSEAKLQTCSSFTIEAVRIHNPRPPSVTPITAFFAAHPRDPSRSRSPSLARSYSDPTASLSKGRVGIHSVWRSKNGEEIGVEEIVLEHLSSQGFKGLHSEGLIIRHIFLLLFWSILFQPVEGAFETSYQIAPLDIAHDSFYFARKRDVEERLEEIEGGEGVRIASEVDGRERKLGTCAIGAGWDLCTREESLEIIECFDGKALAVICKVMCEDYTHRCSGVPDLLVWNYEERKVKFVEVKGPGDTLMENQKVWIDVLLGAGIDVEVCHVEEEGAVELRHKVGKSKTKALDKKVGKARSKAAASASKKGKEKEEETAETPDVESEDEVGPPRTPNDGEDDGEESEDDGDVRMSTPPPTRLATVTTTRPTPIHYTVIEDDSSPPRAPRPSSSATKRTRSESDAAHSSSSGIKRPRYTI